MYAPHLFLSFGTNSKMPHSVPLSEKKINKTATHLMIYYTSGKIIDEYQNNICPMTFESIHLSVCHLSLKKFEKCSQLKQQYSFNNTLEHALGF